MIGAAVLLVWFALIVGCAPMVSINQGQAALLYADAREFYGRVAGPLTVACQAQPPRVPASVCTDLRALQGRLIDLDPQIRKALTEEKSPVDYAMLEKIFGVVLKIGGFLGPIVGLP